ncbi:dTDP-4-dehydrorhamnose 3,5-epimerase [bacterium]|nr:dTDP-4-dehydrorhamnose 3,5-epimerase [bacterium]
MKVTETPIPGVVLLQPQIFGDDRGFFLETYNTEKLAAQNFPHVFVQDNMSMSRRGVLRGLHYQWPLPQGKLVQCIQGEIWDVALDIREGSPTFGQWHAEILNHENRNALYIPEGFAHGFAVLSETALVAYKCTAPYRAEQDAGIIYNDPQFNIPWSIENPQLSPKDQGLPTFKEVAPERRPQF